MTPPRELGPGSLTRRERPDGSAYYVFRWSDGRGRERRKRLGANRYVAERRAAQIIRERDLDLAGLGSVIGRERAWRDVLPDYLAELALRAKPSHVGTCRANIERVLEGCRCRALGDITLRRVQDFRRARSVDRAPRTVNEEVSAVRGFLRWAVQTGLLGSNPIADIGQVKARTTRPPRALTEDEVARVLLAGDRLDAAAERYHQGSEGGLAPQFPRSITLRALLIIGCRWGTARQITWGDVDLECGILVLRGETMKGGRSLTVPISDDLEALLIAARSAAVACRGRIPAQGDAVLLGAQGEPWGVQGSGFRHWFGEVLDAAHVPRIDEHGRRMTPHGLRHTFATRLLRAGVPLPKVMQLGGWRTPHILQRVYAHLEAEDVREEAGAAPLPSVSGNKPAPRPSGPLADALAAARKLLESQGFRVAPRAGLEPATQRLTADSDPSDADRENTDRGLASGDK